MPPGREIDELNPEQRRAVEHGDGPLLVVAGAGTGKTRTLACRVAHLVRSGVPTERILLLTFTRRAARQMLARAARITHGEVEGRAWGGTFHAVGNRLLRRYGRALGLPPSFTVLDQADSADLIDLVRSDLGLGRGEARFPRKDTLAAIHSRTVNAGTPLVRVLREHFPWCAETAEPIRDVFRNYVRRKREQGVLDYDDLLLFWRALLETPAGERVASLFDHVLVDEYQDTNAIQADILAAMRRPPAPAGLTVVGDDAQAIYGFRAATVENILGFADRFPGTTVVRLERNYRSTQPILDVSNAVIDRAERRHRKDLQAARRGDRRPVLSTCHDELEQAESVCRAVLEHREEGLPLVRQAVLFRAAHHSDLLEVELSRRNIPFVKHGGLRFVEAAHVKDLLALLRLLENPFDEPAWFRVLQLLDGVGPATARSMMAALGVREPSRGHGPAHEVERTGPMRRFLDAGLPAVPPSAREEVEALRAALADCLPGSLPVAAEIDRARRFLDPVVRRVYPRAGSRVRDLERLGLLAGTARTRERFLSDLTLDPPAAAGDLAGPPLLDEDYLVLSTIHSAKGCEWDVVHVIHAADGCIPSDMATGRPEEIDEERRLLYVALTRARDTLIVSFPLRYHHRKHERGDAHGYAQVTRFLPEPVRALFDQRGVGPPDPFPDPADPTPIPATVQGVDTFLDSLWE
jgi:DNA helicase II / ATP-dependent DNA helicase PcrA